MYFILLYCHYLYCYHNYCYFPVNFIYFSSDGLAIGIEDVDVGDEGDANGDMDAKDEKDDAELCYTKHTGNTYNINMK